MKVRVDGWGLLEVSDKYKKPLAKIKRDWGAESIYLTRDWDRYEIKVNCLYKGTLLHMPIMVKK